MISRCDVWLGGVALSEVSPSIYVADIAYQAASPTINTSRIAALDGGYSGKRAYLKESKITVSFAVQEYSVQRRQEVVQDVIAWAVNGGWLRASDRFGQRIYVKASKLPAVTSALRWTENLSIEFTAYDYPYWTDETPVKVTVARGDTETLKLRGTYQSCVCAVVTAGAAVTQISITVGDTTLALEDLELQDGDTVTVSYTDEFHLLQIVDGDGVSLLDKRTAASADDLIAQPGENDVSFTADGTASCLISAKGVYM